MYKKLSYKIQYLYRKKQRKAFLIYDLVTQGNGLRTRLTLS